MIYLAPFILVAPLFLLLVGERISARIRDRRTPDPRNDNLGDL